MGSPSARCLMSFLNCSEHLLGSSSSGFAYKKERVEFNTWAIRISTSKRAEELPFNFCWADTNRVLIVSASFLFPQVLFAGEAVSGDALEPITWLFLKRRGVRCDTASSHQFPKSSRIR